MGTTMTTVTATHLGRLILLAAMVVILTGSAATHVMAGEGGVCQSNADCPEQFYCDKPDGACTFAAPGECQPMPVACPPVWDPVCGCDGELYGNDCGAAASGVSVAFKNPGANFGDECDVLIPGDLNGDGVVDVLDLLLLLEDWGPCADPADCPADISGPRGIPDGTVNVHDLLELLNNWG